MKFIQSITDKVSTKKGAWITVAIWLIVMIAVSAGPRLSDYKTTNFQALPDDAPSIIAQNKLDQYFPDEQGTPGIYVFHKPDGNIAVDEVGKIIEGIKDADIDGIEMILDVTKMPPQALTSFISEDQSTMIVPMSLEKDLGSSQYAEINDKATEVGKEIAEELGWNSISRVRQASRGIR